VPMRAQRKASQPVGRSGHQSGLACGLDDRVDAGFVSAVDFKLAVIDLSVDRPSRRTLRSASYSVSRCNLHRSTSGSLG
jgi:hypothetical protein